MQLKHRQPLHDLHQIPTEASLCMLSHDILIYSAYFVRMHCAFIGTWITLWRLGGFGDFRKKTAVFGCLTNALAPPLIALESCSTAQTDRPV